MSYTAIVFRAESINRLMTRGMSLIGHEGWDLDCHHVTLHLGPPTEEERKMLELSFQVIVDGIGKSDKAVALRVKSIKTLSGFEIYSSNAIPHITLRVNRSAGGKPKDSNSITNWVTDERDSTYYGRLRFVP